MRHLVRRGRWPGHGHGNQQRHGSRRRTTLNPSISQDGIIYWDVFERKYCQSHRGISHDSSEVKFRTCQAWATHGRNTSEQNIARKHKSLPKYNHSSLGNGTRRHTPRRALPRGCHHAVLSDVTFWISYMPSIIRQSPLPTLLPHETAVNARRKHRVQCHCRSLHLFCMQIVWNIIHGNEFKVWAIP